jgi:hypothetical protein
MTKTQRLRTWGKKKAASSWEKGERSEAEQQRRALPFCDALSNKMALFTSGITGTKMHTLSPLDGRPFVCSRVA